MPVIDFLYPFKEDEATLGLVGVHPDAVVLNREDPVGTVAKSTHVDAERLAPTGRGRGAAV